MNRLQRRGRRVLAVAGSDQEDRQGFARDDGFSDFEESELAPDANLALQFQAIAGMPEPQQAVIRQLLEGMIIKYEAERWSSRIK